MLQHEALSKHIGDWEKTKSTVLSAFNTLPFTISHSSGDPEGSSAPDETVLSGDGSVVAPEAEDQAVVMPEGDANQTLLSLIKPCCSSFALLLHTMGF